MAFDKVRIADCCIIRPPKTEARKLLKDTDKVSFVPMSDLGIDSKHLSLQEERELSAVSSSYTYFADNDVLLAKITPCFENGKLGIANGLTNGIGFGSSEFIVLRSKDTVVPTYLYYFLSQPSFRLAGQAVMTGAVGHRRVPNDYIEHTEIPLPSISEQKRIVAILDEVFADIEQARAKTEQNLKNTRELFESYLQQVFSQRGEGWADCKMSDVCEITSKLIDPRDDEYLDLPHVGAGNMVSKTGELVDIKTAREEGLISGKFLFDETMVLYSKIRPYLMKVCRPDFTGLCSADVYPLVPISGKLDKDYLFYILLGKNFTDYAISGSGRAGMPKVNRTHLFNYQLNIPSVDKQREYVAKIDQILESSQMLESTYTAKLTALDELKQSILQKAFSGELTQGASKEELT